MRFWACLLLVVTLLCVEVSAHRCGEPSAELVLHGRIGEPTDEYLEISCDSGGERYLSCDQNNQWVPFNAGTCPVPTCDKNKLPSQGDLPVRKESTGNELNDTVTFRCPEGYSGQPISFRCQRKNVKKIKFHWKPQTRTAEGQKLKKLNCTALDELSCTYQKAPHRQIVSKDLMYGIHRIVEDDELTLGCNDGYKLNGDSFVYCDIGGIWDPPELPQCEVIQCELPEREHLSAWLDGTDRPLPPGTNLTYDMKVAWECEEGYTLTRAALTTCNSDWQKNLPSCQAVRCPPIDPPEHGGRVIQNSPSLRGRWRVGSSVVAECNDGYTLLGTRERFCTTAGSWDGTLQICDNKRSTCKNPGKPIAGMKHGNSYNKDDKVTFSCSTGRTMLGSAERVCLDNGEWTGEETRCIGHNEHMTLEEAMMRLGNGIAKLSEKSIDTKLQKDKLRKLMGKQVLLGNNKMETMNINSRTTIQELRDNGGLDVYFVLDTSGSIPKDHKNMSVEIIKNLVHLVGVSAAPGGTGFGFLAFDSSVWNATAVGEKNNTKAIIQHLDKIKRHMLIRPQGGTAPATAFSKLRYLIQTRIWKDRERMKNRSSAIILLSDGIRNEGGDPVRIRDDLIQQSKLNSHEVHVYCIGVGNVRLSLLNQLATNGTDYLVYLRDLSELKEVVNKIYTGNTSFGQCGAQGQQSYTGAIEDVWAKAGTWRWMGGLYYYKDDNPPSDIEKRFQNSEFQCGVSLISKGPNRTQSAWVLTAAHCVYVQGELRDASKLMVKFGSIKSDRNGEDGTVFPVETVIKHSNYSGATLLHDIALLKLKVPVPFEYDIRPVCLHKPSDDHIKVGTMAKVTGWGYLSMQNKTISATLKQLSAKILNSDTCTQSTRGMAKSKYVYPYNFCAGDVTVADRLLDACTFDSGGPLVVCHDEGLKKLCTQVGIVSFGDGCGEEDKYGVYTNTTTYYKWVNDTMNAP